MKRIIFLFLLIVCTKLLFAQTYNVDVFDVSIQGDLLEASNKEHLAIIIAGSGPTDRNGNSGMGLRTNAYRLLAEALQDLGISAFRFDKRWIGASVPQSSEPSTAVLEDYVQDVCALVEHFKVKGFQSVVLIGHSEGSTIALSCALNNPSVAAVVSIAGAGKSIDQVIVDQISAQLEPLGKEAEILFDSLAQGFTPKKVHPFLLSVFRPEVMPFLASYTRFHPAELISQVNQPILIVQGTTDIQVGVEHAEMLHKARPEAVLKIYEGMNHILKTAEADRAKNIATYNQPDLPLFEGLANDIAHFIKNFN